MKISVNERILFLAGNQRDLRMRVAQLERRIGMLEARLEEKDIEALRFI